MQCATVPLDQGGGPGVERGVQVLGGDLHFGFTRTTPRPDWGKVSKKRVWVLILPWGGSYVLSGQSNDQLWVAAPFDEPLEHTQNHNGQKRGQF